MLFYLLIIFILFAVCWKKFNTNKFNMIAPFYDYFIGSFERKTLLPFRKRFVPMIQGSVLDLAAGTGPNIEFYDTALPHVSQVTLVDKSQAMLDQAKQKKNHTNVPLDFVASPLEKLPFGDEQFDSILSIDVFCSVQDQRLALREVLRVLKPSGKAIFVEHFKTDNWISNIGLYLITYLLMNWLLDISMVRETDKSIRASGFKVLEQGKLGHSFQYFICEKENK